MKKITLNLVFLALSFSLLAQPTSITWQGKLLDASGNAITQTNISMNFAMFDAFTGGNQLWPASGVVTKTVDVVQGLYSLQLGTGFSDDIAFTAAMFDGKSPWLEVKVGTEILPRTEITNVPFALISNDLSAAGWENPGEIGKNTPNSGEFSSLKTGSLKVANGASEGKVLTSDINGNATWQNTALANFEESNFTFDSRTGVKLATKNADENVDLVFSPKGAGAIMAQQPDGAANGGDNRGTNAVDFQLSRGLSSQVAGGSFSVIAGGYWNEASRNHAVVGGGSGNTASGSYSLVPGGKSNTAEGLASTAFGVNNEARGTNSTAFGYNNSADGDYTLVTGYHNIANDYLESILGRYASMGYGSTSGWIATDRLFTIGNGTADARSNALTVLKNGNTTIGGTLKVNQNISMAWYTFPETRGLPGQVMTTDGDGHAEWTTLSDNGYLLSSGNSFGIPINVGTNDDKALNLITNSQNRLTISNAGIIAIPAMTTSGILHNNASGILSSSLIVNDDISATAAIADSKLATISTAGKVSNSATTATSSNTAGTIVLRDASGNFSAGTITASISGNASSATTTTHISGGAQGSLPYQTAAGTSTFLVKGTAGQVLTMNSGATAPEWGSETDPRVPNGTQAGQMQYWDGTAWITVDAGQNGQILRFVNGVPTWVNDDLINKLVVGDYYQGGIIAYFLQSGDPGYDANIRHGLIAAPYDQGTYAEWGCHGTQISGAVGTALGTGAQNTLDIVAGCSTASIAARICDDLVLNGYSDWYLPCKDELNKLYLNKTAIGGFADYYYWSSSEISSFSAWLQFFYDGDQLNFNKFNEIRVRAVRAF